MIANGKDDANLRISVADSAGYEIMDSFLDFEISVKGDATITEPDGSDPELVSQSYSAFKREIHQVVFGLPDNRGNGTAIWEPLNTWSRILDRQENTLEEINIYDEMSRKYLIK